MKKHFFILLISFSGIFATAQVTQITNKVNKEYSEIPGTKYLMIKPDSTFEVSKTFTGFENSSLQAGINISEPPLPFEQLVQMISKDMPPANGKLIFERDYIIDGNPAKLFKTEMANPGIAVQSDDSGDTSSTVTGLIMIYKNDSTAILISGIYPAEKDKELGDKFIRSFLSFMYQKNKKTDPLQALNFALDTSATDLKFASIIMQKGALFNMDGKFPTQADDNTAYMVLVMPFPVEDKEEQKDMAIKLVKPALEPSIEIKEVNEIEVNGIKGIEVAGYWKNKKGEYELKYGVAFFTPQKTYVINASSTVEPEKKLKMFKTFTRTFKLK